MDNLFRAVIAAPKIEIDKYEKEPQRTNDKKRKKSRKRAS
jgi:hypothetical protein